MTKPIAHIGIVGCSAEGAALCYRTICALGAERLGPHAHPEITMHTPPLCDYMDRIHGGDWEGVAELILASAEKLARVGADFLISPENTIHQAFGHVAARSPLPWLHIAEVVADEAAARGFQQVGLLGTRWLVDSAVYPEKLSARGLRHLRPRPTERDEINRYIIEELTYGISSSEARACHQRVIQRMKDEGCDAVVLGCTEIPLLMNDDNAPLPTLDSTRLLARAALLHAMRDAGL